MARIDDLCLSHAAAVLESPNCSKMVTRDRDITVYREALDKELQATNERMLRTKESPQGRAQQFVIQYQMVSLKNGPK